MSGRILVDLFEQYFGWLNIQEHAMNFSGLKRNLKMMSGKLVLLFPFVYVCWRVRHFRCVGTSRESQVSFAAIFASPARWCQDNRFDPWYGAGHRPDRRWWETNQQRTALPILNITQPVTNTQDHFRWCSEKEFSGQPLNKRWTRMWSKSRTQLRWRCSESRSNWPRFFRFSSQRRDRSDAGCDVTSSSCESNCSENSGRPTRSIPSRVDDVAHGTQRQTSTMHKVQKTRVNVQTRWQMSKDHEGSSGLVHG